MPHFTPARLLNARVSIDLVGCGGNGSQMLTGLARLNHAITALGHPGLNVTVYDPDTVSEANMGRQLFSAADVGQFKAVVSTHRINAFFGLKWDAVPRRYTSRIRAADILISCVDSTHARAEIQEHAGRTGTHYLLDLGNRAADGQVLFGEADEDPQPNKAHGHVPLPHPYSLFPELVDTQSPADATPSCGLAEALERQELFVNQAVVTPALSILWEFFRHGRLTWHGAFVNLRTGSMRPLNVKEAAA